MYKDTKAKEKDNTKVPSVSDEDIIGIIDKGDTIKLNDVTKRLGEYYAFGKDEREKLSSAQIRNVLDKIQRMKDYNKDQLQLLRPLLAYVAGKDRTPDKKLKHLQEIMDKAITRVDDDKKFTNLRNFFEAIVAYHRYYGGK
jgi:CRISPR-associated protein Csm2